MKPGYIVAIGGSAGFLTPLIKILSATPKDNASYVILRHISIDAVSHLDKILGKHSNLEIRQIEDFTKLELNKVYILPPGYYAIIGDGRFILTERRGSLNCAVDVFLNSVAAEFKNRVIAIILSGAGSNGSEGIINVKKCGGLVLAQRPDTCEFPFMPQNAIKTGCVDKILLAEEMPQAIESFQREIADNT